MFQFPRCPRSRLCVHPAVTRHHPRRVAPFGFPRISACPRLPEAFRRVATSFVGRRRQGIHRAPSAQFASFAYGSHRSSRHPPTDPLIAGVGGSQAQSAMRRSHVLLVALLVSSVVKVPGGAAGIRTPDLLIANETRYQLRHSPLNCVRNNIMTGASLRQAHQSTLTLPSASRAC
jgi:hypothetical protein